MNIFRRVISVLSGEPIHSNKVKNVSNSKVKLLNLGKKVKPFPLTVNSNQTDNKDSSDLVKSEVQDKLTDNPEKVKDAPEKSIESPKGTNADKTDLTSVPSDGLKDKVKIIKAKDEVGNVEKAKDELDKLGDTKGKIEDKLDKPEKTKDKVEDQAKADIKPKIESEQASTSIDTTDSTVNTPVVSAFNSLSEDNKQSTSVETSQSTSKPVLSFTRSSESSDTVGKPKEKLKKVSKKGTIEKERIDQNANAPKKDGDKDKKSKDKGGDKKKKDGKDKAGAKKKDGKDKADAKNKGGKDKADTKKKDGKDKNKGEEKSKKSKDKSKDSLTSLSTDKSSKKKKGKDKGTNATASAASKETQKDTKSISTNSTDKKDKKDKSSKKTGKKAEKSKGTQKDKSASSDTSKSKASKKEKKSKKSKKDESTSAASKKKTKEKKSKKSKKKEETPAEAVTLQVPPQEKTVTTPIKEQDDKDSFMKDLSLMNINDIDRLINMNDRIQCRMCCSSFDTCCTCGCMIGMDRCPIMSTSRSRSRNICCDRRTKRCKSMTICRPKLSWDCDNVSYLSSSCSDSFSQPYKYMAKETFCGRPRRRMVCIS